MDYDYSKLRGKIREVFGTQEVFAANLNISQSLLSQRINTRSDFRQDEIMLATKLLSIPIADIPSYFFTLKNEKTQLIAG